MIGCGDDVLLYVLSVEILVLPIKISASIAVILLFVIAEFICAIVHVEWAHLCSEHGRALAEDIWV
jgi:hypothetical protein